jgi:hypothetical protein
MGINSRQIVCGICGAVMVADLFSNHHHPHAHANEPVYPLSPWGAQAWVISTSTSSSSSR